MSTGPLAPASVSCSMTTPVWTSRSYGPEVASLGEAQIHRGSDDSAGAPLEGFGLPPPLCQRAGGSIPILTASPPPVAAGDGRRSTQSADRSRIVLASRAT